MANPIVSQLDNATRRAIMAMDARVASIEANTGNGLSIDGGSPGEQFLQNVTIDGGTV